MKHESLRHRDHLTLLADSYLIQINEPHSDPVKLDALQEGCQFLAFNWNIGIGASTTQFPPSRVCSLVGRTTNSIVGHRKANTPPAPVKLAA